MNAVVFEHVPVADLPQAWQDRLGQELRDGTDARVTVRIEAETMSAAQGEAAFANDPLFGMWRDREDMADVAGYVRRIRAPRFNADSSATEP